MTKNPFVFLIIPPFSIRSSTPSLPDLNGEVYIPAKNQERKMGEMTTGNQVENRRDYHRTTFFESDKCKLVRPSIHYWTVDRSTFSGCYFIPIQVSVGTHGTHPIPRSERDSDGTSYSGKCASGRDFRSPLHCGNTFRIQWPK